MSKLIPMDYATAKPGVTLHIETPLGIINIRAGLTDHKGRKVDSIEIIPNSDLVDGCKVKCQRMSYGDRLIVNKTPEHMIPGKRVK